MDGNYIESLTAAILALNEAAAQAGADTCSAPDGSGTQSVRERIETLSADVKQFRNHLCSM